MGNRGHTVTGDPHPFVVAAEKAVDTLTRHCVWLARRNDVLWICVNRMGGSPADYVAAKVLDRSLLAGGYRTLAVRHRHLLLRNEALEEGLAEIIAKADNPKNALRKANDLQVAYMRELEESPKEKS